MLYRAARRLLFHFDAETVHERVLDGLHRFGDIGPVRAAVERRMTPSDPRLRTELFGHRLPSPLAIAAGLDKNGTAVAALDALGFAFVEVGTVTLRPQAGNPRPRVFRLPEDAALINRMGFPNEGMEAVARNLRSARGSRFALNVGPNKDRIDHTLEDCLNVIEELAVLRPIYVIVNVSSPNTALLRQLQGKEALTHLLTGIRDGRSPVAAAIPLLVKIAPDLSDAELDDVLEVVMDLRLPGIVAANTTTARPNTLRGADRSEGGGLSGRPLTDRSTAMVARIRAVTGGALTIIAAGGVFDGADVLDKIGAGATVVQTYTGFVYGGPGMARAVHRDICRIFDTQGISGFDVIRGTGYRAPRPAS